MKVERHPNNPIVSKRDIPCSCGAVFNAGAISHQGKDLLLLRVEKPTGYSKLGIATFAKDKLRVYKNCPSVFNRPGISFEDARVTKIGNNYYVVAVVVNPKQQSFHLNLYATTNFFSFGDLGVISSPFVKNGALFPDKIGGYFWMTLRPADGNMWVAGSPDLKHWGDYSLFMEKGKMLAWDSARIGIGPSPIRINGGWLIIFHGVKHNVNGDTYSLGIAYAIEKNRRPQVISRYDSPILIPEKSEDKEGQVPNAVFSCGAVKDEDNLRIYYGAGDQVVCLATASVSELLGLLKIKK